MHLPDAEGDQVQMPLVEFLRQHCRDLIDDLRRAWSR